ncbi:hypothetical protein Y1Q_0023481 [Alligator mississippiensis]|uniref:Uncharacterized protein n=1 Tax=Alligator mississippiensis TaxID=8496 RepID=A0A151NQ19_ALLMI|nr:hypothetical protein Y1Q_0023481 [Alligator mississippiensis]
MKAPAFTRKMKPGPSGCLQGRGADWMTPGARTQAYFLHAMQLILSTISRMVQLILSTISRIISGMKNTSVLGIHSLPPPLPMLTHPRARSV